MKFRLAAFFIHHMASLLAGTLRLSVAGEERVRDLQQRGSGVILVTWHGRTFVPIMRFRKRGYWAIVSTSRDGEFLFHLFHRLGWQTVRGSTSARGAVRSALAMTKHLKEGATLAFTPDGPRGPRGNVYPGTIFMAQKSGCPVIPVGISAAPRRLMPTWDRYLLPLPFARAVWIYGEPLSIPPGTMSQEEEDRWADRISEAINALQEEAERIASSPAPHDQARRDTNQWHRA